MKKHKHSHNEKLFLCTGGLSKALFISLLISKLLKYTNYQCACFFMAFELNDFDTRKSVTRAIGSSLVAISGP
jgi:hypothetical protein